MLTNALMCTLFFIMFFGLFLGNLDELKQLPFIEKLHPEVLNKEVMNLEYKQ